MYPGKSEHDVKQTESLEKIGELQQFIFNLAGEYEDRLNLITSDKNNSLNSLSRLEEQLSAINLKKADSSVLFSPNSISYNTNTITSEIENLKRNIRNITLEQENLRTKITGLKKTADILDKKNKCQEGDFGLTILQMQEQDRQRIARDLHDSTVQNLTGLIHKCELCYKLAEVDQVRTKLELATISSTIKSIINEIRDIIYNLKPMSLDDLGLYITIERYANQLMLNHNIEITVKHQGEESSNIPAVVKLSLFRVIQEACNNAIKHANATRIDIYISYRTDKLTVTIQDNGKGFDIEKQKENIPDNTSGYGLSIMKERIHLLSGTLELSSAIEKGTIVTVSVPITNFEGDKNEQTN